MNASILMLLAVTAFSPVVLAATELANVNGKAISLEEFNRRYEESLKFYQFRVPSKKEVLEDMVRREVGIQEAKKLGLDKDPVVQDRINTLLYNALLEKKVGPEIEKIFVTEDDARDFYKRSPEIRTSHIFVAVNLGASETDVKKASDKIREIKDRYLKDEKVSFAEVAQKYSEGNAAPMGGDLDYQFRDRLDPTYYEAARALKVGQVSEIVRSPMGFHIIKLTAIRPFEETDKNRVKRLAFEEKRLGVFEKYLVQLRSKGKVSVKSDLIK